MMKNKKLKLNVENVNFDGIRVFELDEMRIVVEKLFPNMYKGVKVKIQIQSTRRMLLSLFAQTVRVGLFLLSSNSHLDSWRFCVSLVSTRSCEPGEMNVLFATSIHIARFSFLIGYHFFFWEFGKFVWQISRKFFASTKKQKHILVHWLNRCVFGKKRQRTLLNVASYPSLFFEFNYGS